MTTTSSDAPESKLKTTKVYALQCIVNDWKYQGRTFTQTELESLRIEHWGWITKHLPTGKDKRIDEHSLSPVEFIRYYNFLNHECEQKIKLVPKNDIKIHHIDFDAAGVKGLCHELAQVFSKAKKRTNDDEERGVSDGVLSCGHRIS